MKLKVGDTVEVTAGKDKGRRGKIEEVFPKESSVLVLGVNVYKRHRKGLGREKGGIIEFARPLDVANVALVCPSCGKQTRIAYKVEKGGKLRVCSKCKKAIELPKEIGGKKQ